MTKTEEHLMRHLWTHEPCFLGELYAALPEPRPAKTTVATLLKRMIDKEAVGFETFGNNRRYFSRVSKGQYFMAKLNGIAGDFFGGSPSALASFFVGNSELTAEQLAELRALLDRKDPSDAAE